MIKAKSATNLQPVFFEWDGKFKVQIKDVKMATRQALIKANEETTFDKKHRKTTDLDWLRFGKAFMREAIAGWTGMTYGYLLEICRPIDLDPGVKLADPIEFTEENFQFVLDNYRPDFSLFVNHAVDRLDEIYTEQKKKELENL